MTATDAARASGGARFVGQRVPRQEDARFLTGRGQYVDDIFLPDTLHVAFARRECLAARPSWTRGDAQGPEQRGCLVRAVARSELLEAAMGHLRPVDRSVDVAGLQQQGEVELGAGGFEGQLETGEELQCEPEVVPGRLGVVLGRGEQAGCPRD